VRPIVILSNIIIDEVYDPVEGMERRSLGGAAVYAAAAARLWWPNVGILAGIGEDFEVWAGPRLAPFRLRDEGHLVRDAHTLISRLTYDDRGQRGELPVYGTDHFAKLDLGASHLPAAFLPARGTYVFRDLDPTHWQQLSEKRSVLGIVLWELHDRVAAPGLVPLLIERLRLVDIFSLNWSEMRGLFGDREEEDVLSFLLDQGVDVVILRKGAEGALIASSGERLQVRPAQLAVVDVTGGGNAFCGGFLAGWCRSDGDLIAACRYAAASAAIALRQFGPGTQLDTETAMSLAMHVDVRAVGLTSQAPLNSAEARTR
jgi:sugar/nucleoside kinase (ribokinase family)